MFARQVLAADQVTCHACLFMPADPCRASLIQMFLRLIMPACLIHPLASITCIGGKMEPLLANLGLRLSVVLRPALFFGVQTLLVGHLVAPV